MANLAGHGRRASGDCGVTDRVSILVLIVFALGGSWLAQAHATVAAKVERIDAVQQDDHDRLARIEAQLEYVGKLTLTAINDQRTVAGKPLVPDEFPRGGE